VRWTHGVRVGDGQPLFSFYQPGFYYLVQLAHLLVSSLSFAMKLTVLALWTSGAAFMFRLSAHRGWMPAALGALVFAGAPYLLLDVYVRAAWPEFAAIAFAVGAMWALARLLDSPGAGRAVLVAALLAAALVCHLPATLIFCPVLVARAIALCFASPDRRRAFLWCGAAVALAAGLSAFYVIPALSERPLIQMGTLTRDYFDYRNHFVEPAQWLRYSWGFGASVAGAADGMSFQVGIVQWLVIVAAVFCCLRAAARRSLTPDDRDLAFWLAVVAFALFMMSKASSAVWAAAPLLAYLQFPWRFLMLIAVASGCLAANLLARLRGVRSRAAVLTAVAALLLVASREQRRPDHYVPRRAMDIDRPAWANTPEAAASAFVEPGYFPAGPGGHGASSSAERSRRLWITSDPAAIVTPRATRDHEVELVVQSAAGTDVTLAWRMFPAWTISLDGREVRPGVEPRHGFVIVQAPPGRHTLEARFLNTRIRSIANTISAVTAILIVLLRASIRLRKSYGLAQPLSEEVTHVEAGFAGYLGCRPGDVRAHRHRGHRTDADRCGPLDRAGESHPRRPTCVQPRVEGDPRRGNDAARLRADRRRDLPHSVS
jgi:hypothetical protein